MPFSFGYGAEEMPDEFAKILDDVKKGKACFPTFTPEEIVRRKRYTTICVAMGMTMGGATIDLFGVTDEEMDVLWEQYVVPYEAKIAAKRKRQEKLL